MFDLKNQKELLAKIMVNEEELDQYDCYLCQRPSSECEFCGCLYTAEGLARNNVIVLPCATGDTVYEVRAKFSDNTPGSYIEDYYIKPVEFKYAHLDIWNERVFKTIEEARIKVEELVDKE